MVIQYVDGEKKRHKTKCKVVMESGKEKFKTERKKKKWNWSTPKKTPRKRATQRMKLLPGKKRRVKVQREAWREDSIMEVYHQKYGKKEHKEVSCR